MVPNRHAVVGLQPHCDERFVRVGQKKIRAEVFIRKSCVHKWKIVDAFVVRFMSLECTEQLDMVLYPTCPLYDYSFSSVAV